MPDDRSLGELQRYTADRPLELPTSAVDLWRRLRAELIKASNTKKVATPPRQIDEYVQLLNEPRPQLLDELRKLDLHRNAACIVGGMKNQNRDDRLQHFKRNDGAWFDFSITVRKLGDRLELLAYDFEIRFMPGMGTSFLRFDLNLPDSRNRERELRCHLHPGSDDILVPAPLMTPSEVLALFIDGARLPAHRKPRAPTDFDVSWLRQTLARIPGAGGSPAP